MSDFVTGQRWISTAEPELGLGIVAAASSDRITLSFPACGESRTYARRNHPLARARFGPGEAIASAEGTPYRVEAVDEKEGRLIYLCTGADGSQTSLEEAALSHILRLCGPKERLFSGQLDPTAWYTLRRNTWQQLGKQARSPVRGLGGGRTSLIPHQLYVVHEVAGRHAPRVLLADEVGLGKTIEAGLIIHHQRLCGRADRVLIVVPETLQHQWLVEMLRRFNLRFSLFDEERCTQSDHENPFHGEQLVLCSLAWLTRHPARQAQARAGDFDLLVVDEAHHLAWSESQASAEYLCIEGLATAVAGVLLLTATPEQLGIGGHFARLRLLDPDRFFDFKRFLEEQNHYRLVAETAARLLDDIPLTSEMEQMLGALLKQEEKPKLLQQLGRPAAKDELLNLLLDRHGTGRIFFRNTRATVSGFPPRQLHACPLPSPAVPEPEPDDDIEAWERNDPRIGWLIDRLAELRDAKVLLVCSAAATILVLENVLRLRTGIRTALFHEGMSLIARDRAAAYFAQEENGARVLLCSEIGSEGRNFQFAHHLVLFDLPQNPELLEQRIGRLDRIGQTETIHIHVPFVENSAQHILFRWYHEGLDAFRRHCPAALAVHAQIETTLRNVLEAPSSAKIKALVKETRRLRAGLGRELENGRDRLLELTSCRQEVALSLIAELEKNDAADTVWPYMEAVFECFGMDSEPHSERCHIVTPSHHMRLPQFPELPDDGVTVTLDRSIALGREELQFLTWEHPMVTGAMDLVLSGEYGNAALSVIRHPALKPAQLLLEAIYILECSAPKSLQIDRFMPPTPLRVLIDRALANLAPEISAESLCAEAARLDAVHAARLIQSQKPLMESMLAAAQRHADSAVAPLVARGLKDMIRHHRTEIDRLEALRRVNPNVRPEEIEHLRQEERNCRLHMERARLRLDALRVILTA